MNTMTYKGYTARVEFDEDDEVFTGRVLGVNDVIGFHAETVAALKQAFHEAVDDYIDACARIGKKPEKTFSGNLMFRVAPELHAGAALAAEKLGKSLNQWAEEALANALGKPSGPIAAPKKTVKRQAAKRPGEAATRQRRLRAR